MKQFLFGSSKFQEKCRLKRHQTVLGALGCPSSLNYLKQIEAYPLKMPSNFPINIPASPKTSHICNLPFVPPLRSGCQICSTFMSSADRNQLIYSVFYKRVGELRIETDISVAISDYRIRAGWASKMWARSPTIEWRKRNIIIIVSKEVAPLGIVHLLTICRSEDRHFNMFPTSRCFGLASGLKY